jgi:hypothetical protein
MSPRRHLTFAILAIDLLAADATSWAQTAAALFHPGYQNFYAAITKLCRDHSALQQVVLMWVHVKASPGDWKEIDLPAAQREPAAIPSISLKSLGARISLRKVRQDQP